MVGGDSTTAWILRGFKCRHALAVQKGVGVPYREAKALVRQVRERFEGRNLAAALAMAPLLIGIWVVEFLLFRMLGLTGVDPLGALERVVGETRLGWAAFYFVLIVMFLLIPAIIANAIAGRIDERPFRAELRRCVEEPACFNCGYSMAGLDEPTCPECGRTWPARRTQTSETHLDERQIDDPVPSD